MPHFVNDLKEKALDVWRRAPTVVIVCGLVLLLLCVTCCLCGGCLPGGEDVPQPPAVDRSSQVGVDLSMAEFEAEIDEVKMSKAAFFRAYGQPDRTTEIGVFTFLNYTCQDGRVKVRCRTAPWKENDEVQVVSVEQE